MITAWTTDDSRNVAIVSRAVRGLQKCGVPVDVKLASQYDGIPRPSLSYGVLRGTGRIYRQCSEKRIPWWNIDNGFFRPGYPLGYFRIGYCHLQPRFIKGHQEDDLRWRKLILEIRPWRKSSKNGPVLVCPPEGICEFYGLDRTDWTLRVMRAMPAPYDSRIHVRLRSDKIPLIQDLFRSCYVVTHSSNVAIEALMFGVPAIADTGFVRSWNDLSIHDVGTDQTQLDRRQLFAQAAASQFTLDEISDGTAWEILKAKGQLE